MIFGTSEIELQISEIIRANAYVIRSFFDFFYKTIAIWVLVTITILLTIRQTNKNAESRADKKLRDRVKESDGMVKELVSMNRNKDKEISELRAEKNAHDAISARGIE